MKRTALKTITNKKIKYIPDTYQELDVNAEDIYDRPMVFCGSRMNREQKFEFQEIMKLKYPKDVDISKLSQDELQNIVITEGKAEAYRYLWATCIHSVENVIISIEGEEKTFDKVEKGDPIFDMLWTDAEGIDFIIMEVITFFAKSSSFTEVEAKN